MHEINSLWFNRQSCPAAVEPPSGAIQPCHIREAMRRYNYRHTVCTCTLYPLISIDQKKKLLFLTVNKSH